MAVQVFAFVGRCGRRSWICYRAREGRVRLWECRDLEGRRGDTERQVSFAEGVRR